MKNMPYFFAKCLKDIIVVSMLFLVAFNTMPVDAEDTDSEESESTEASESQQAPFIDDIFGDYFDYLGDDWEPFKEMERIQQEMNRLFRRSFQRGFSQSHNGASFESSLFFEPEIDVINMDDAYRIELDLRYGKIKLA